MVDLDREVEKQLNRPKPFKLGILIALGIALGIPALLGILAVGLRFAGWILEITV